MKCPKNVVNIGGVILKHFIGKNGLSCIKTICALRSRYIYNIVDERMVNCLVRSGWLSGAACRSSEMKKLLLLSIHFQVI